MDLFLELLYIPIKPLMWHPERAFIGAFIFIVLVVISVLVNRGRFRLKYIWPLLLAFCFWILFGINEYIMYSTKADLRIDLLLFGPALILVSVFAIYSFIRSLFHWNE